MNKNVGETLQYDHKAKVSGYYELVQGVLTGQAATSFNASEQLQTFDIASGARAVNWKTLNVTIVVSLTFAGNQTGVSYYVRKSNSWISRVVLRSKVGKYAVDVTNCFAFSSTIPYRKNMNSIDFSANRIHGDLMNDAVSTAANAARWMQEDYVILGLNDLTSHNIEQVNTMTDVIGGIFNVDKDIPLTTGFYLDVYLAPVSNVIFQIGSPNAYNNTTASAAAENVRVNIVNLNCSFCQQADDQINVGLLSYLSGGGKMIIPFDYIQCQTQQTSPSTSHQISQPITTSIGDKLKKIYYMVGINDPTSVNGYHLRYGQTVFSQTSAISQITLTLNNRVIGIYDISKKDHNRFKYGFPDCDDNQYIQQMGNGTTTKRGLKVVNNNFFIPIEIENLTQFEDQYDANTGLPILSDSNFTVRVTLTGQSPASLTHYVWMVGTKYLNVSGSGIEILP